MRVRFDFRRTMLDRVEVDVVETGAEIAMVADGVFLVLPVSDRAFASKAQSRFVSRQRFHKHGFDREPSSPEAHTRGLHHTGVARYSPLLRFSIIHKIANFR